MTTFYAILVGGTIHGKGGPSTAAVDGPAGPVTAADHIWRDIYTIRGYCQLVGSVGDLFIPLEPFRVGGDYRSSYYIQYSLYDYASSKLSVKLSQ